MINVELLKRHYLQAYYDENTCHRCSELKNRHSAVCTPCPAFLGRAKLWNEVNTESGVWYGVPNGHLSRVSSLLGVDLFYAKDQRAVVPMPFPLTFTGQLYDGTPYPDGKPRVNQQELVKTWLQYKFGIIRAPPRSGGKTVVACYLTCASRLRTMIVVHQDNIAQQFLRTFQAFTNLKELSIQRQRLLVGIVYKMEDFNKFPDVCIVNYQKFIGDRSDRIIRHIFGKFGFLIIDECVTGDTLILTHKGLLPIETLTNPDHILNTWRKIDLQIMTEKGISIATHIYRTKKKVFKILTNSKYEIVASSNHPILTLDNNMRLCYKYISDLNINDVVCINRGQPLFPNDTVKLQDTYEYYGNEIVCTIPPVLDNKLAKLLGYVVSEGHTSDNRIEFSNTNKDILKDFEINMKEVFDVNCTIDNSYDKEHKEYNKDRRKIVNSTAIVHFFKYMGCKFLSNKKVVPWSILQAPKEQVVEFLRAYFEGDGSVESGQITATSASEILLKQIQIILLNFKIYSHRRSSIDYRWNPPVVMHYLHINGACIEIFTKEIGFISTIKTVQLTALNTKYKKQVKYRKYFDWMPYMQELKNFLTRKYSNNKNGTYNCEDGHIRRLKLFSEKRNYHKWFHTQDSLRKLMPNINYLDNRLYKRLQNLLDRGYFFDNIIDKTECGDAFVYDLCVPNNNSFVANGIIVHNCHNVGALAYSRVINRIDSKFKLGLTATPWRRDHRHLISRDVVGPVTAESQVVAIVPEIFVHWTNIGLSPFKSFTRYKRWLHEHEERRNIVVRQVFIDLRAGHRVIIIPVDTLAYQEALVGAINQQAIINKFKRHEPWPEQLAVAFNRNSDQQKILQLVDSGNFVILVAIRKMIREGINMMWPSVLYSVEPASAVRTNNIGAPLFEQLAHRICTYFPQKPPPIIRLFVDSGISHACAKNLLRYEILRRAKLRRNPAGVIEQPRYQISPDQLKIANWVLSEPVEGMGKKKQFQRY